MKNIFTIVFISLFQIVLGQNTTTPTGTSTEVGVTDGQLSVSLSGAATYNIPIEVPPGLNGVVPQLSLNYSSQSGNGMAGYGWNIGGLSSITRIPSTKFHDGTDDPVDFDALDRFALDGQRLIVKAGTTGVYGADGTQYETENFSNLRITSIGVHPNGANYGPIGFKVQYPDGSIGQYGYDSDSRTILSWGISRWKNPKNIGINYKYTVTNNILYLYYISYGEYVWSFGSNFIEFIYKTRQRSEESLINGISIEETKILSEIHTGIKKYSLNHEVSLLKYERLRSVFEANTDGTVVQNPTVFEYE